MPVKFKVTDKLRVGRLLWLAEQHTHRLKTRQPGLFQWASILVPQTRLPVTRAMKSGLSSVSLISSISLSSPARFFFRAGQETGGLLSSAVSHVWTYRQWATWAVKNALHAAWRLSWPHLLTLAISAETTDRRKTWANYANVRHCDCLLHHNVLEVSTTDVLLKQLQEK